VQIGRKALYLDVIDTLMKRIQEGKYPPGAKLPSEDQLARELGISRVSLREGLRVMSEDGILFRRQGSGTFVRDKKALPVQDLSTILSIPTMFKRAGLEHKIVKADYDKIISTGRVAEKLQTSSGAEVWKVERLRKIGDQLAMYSLDYFPASLVPPGGEERFKDYLLFSIYHFLREICGQDSDQGSCTLKPILADEKLVEIMKVPRNTPFMLIETIDLNPEQKPVLYAREYYFADLFEFQVNRRRGDSDL
jgi:GntR family transcriptional regulator